MRSKCFRVVGGLEGSYIAANFHSSVDSTCRRLTSVVPVSSYQCVKSFTSPSVLLLWRHISCRPWFQVSPRRRRRVGPGVDPIALLRL